MRERAQGAMIGIQERQEAEGEIFLVPVCLLLSVPSVPFLSGSSHPPENVKRQTHVACVMRSSTVLPLAMVVNNLLHVAAATAENIRSTVVM